MFECDKSDVVNIYDDKSAHRGSDYYYYIQSKDDGTQNDVKPGQPLLSSPVWTVTSQPATLQRPAIPDGPMPFDTTYWKLVTDKGFWTIDTTYLRYDMVSYGGLNYVCVLNDSNSAVNPSLNYSYWKPTLYKGLWTTGQEYKPFDMISYENFNYVTLYSISGGLGLDLIRVVPNPYDIRARLFQFGDKSQYDRINFYGLPAICKLKIFTERGDLIWEKDHTRGTGDEIWDSTTSSGQIVSSGIYILYVETPDGRQAIRKFVIIR